MGAKRGQPPKVSAADWVRAALTAMVEHGVRGVAVESLASTLGVTKGSFYGYFGNRDELIAAALALWESEQEAHLTVMVPPRQAMDPVRRLELIAASTLLGQRRGPATRSELLVAEISAVELSLTNDRHRQDVADALSRVGAVRVGFLAACLREIGHQSDDARQLAIAAYTLRLGTDVLRRNAPLVADMIDEDYVTATITPYFSPHPEAGTVPRETACRKPCCHDDEGRQVPTRADCPSRGAAGRPEERQEVRRSA